MRFVPIERVYTEVQEEIGDDWYGEQPVYSEWCKTAIRKIASPVSFDFVIEELKVDENGYNVPICEDTYSVKALTPGKKKKELTKIFSNDCGFLKYPEYQKGNNEFGNGLLIVSSAPIIGNRHNIRWKVEDGSISFYNKISDSHVTVLSKKFKRDKYGKIMPAETDVEACAAYILWRIAKRTNWGQKEKRLPKYVIDNYDLEWTNKLGNARAEGAEMSASREYEFETMMHFRNLDIVSRNIT